MKLRFTTDWISSTGVVRRQGDIRDYPDGVADLLIRRKKAEPVVERPIERPKKRNLDP